MSTRQVATTDARAARPQCDALRRRQLAPACRGWLASVAVLACLLLSAAAPASAARGRMLQADEVNTLMARLQAKGTYKQILALMIKGKPGEQTLAGFLRSILALPTTKITLVLPTDAAWPALSATMRTRLTTATTRDLVRFLQFYVLKARLPLAPLLLAKEGATYATYQGSLLAKKPSKVKGVVILGPPNSANQATIKDGDTYTSPKMVIHGTDKFLLPPGWS